MTNIRDFPNSTARRDLHAVTSWLDNLASLTAGTVPLPDQKAKIASLASALVEEYPPAAFTRASLLAVGRQCKFMPSYAELIAALTAWWSENRPMRPAIAGPEPYEHVPTPPRTAPTTYDLVAVGDIVRRGVEGIHEHYNRTYHPPGTPAAPTTPKPRYLSTDQLAAARQAIGAPPSKVTA